MVNGVSNPYKDEIKDVPSFKQAVARRESLKMGGLGEAISNLVDAFAGSQSKFGKTCEDAIVNAAKLNPDASLHHVANTFVNALKDKGLIDNDGQFKPGLKNPVAACALPINQAASNVAVMQSQRVVELKAQFASKVIAANTKKPATAAETMTAIHAAKQTKAGTTGYAKAFTDLVNVIRRGGDEMIRTFQAHLDDQLKASVFSLGATSSSGENFNSKYVSASNNLDTLRDAAPRQDLHVTNPKSSIGRAAMFHQASALKGEISRFHESDKQQMTKTPDLHANANKGMATFKMREEAFAGKLLRAAEKAGKNIGSVNSTNDSTLIGEYISQSGRDAFHGVISLIASNDGHFVGLVDGTANSIAVASSENSGFVVTMTSTMNVDKVPVDLNETT